jgi:hypothetical protein
LREVEVWLYNPTSVPDPPTKVREVREARELRSTILR